MMAKVIYTSFAEKQLRKVPKYIKEALNVWACNIERIGIAETRKVKGCRSYRAIYEEQNDGELILISVIEVNKHDY